MQERLKLRRANVAKKSEIVSDRDTAGLLGYNDYYRVASFGNTDRRSVASTEAGVEIHSLSQGEEASCGNDLVSGNDYSAVVKRRSVEEEVSEQEIVYVSVDIYTGLYNVGK